MVHGTQNNYSSNIESHWLPFFFMEKFEILWKLPKYDKETQSEQFFIF